LVNTLQVNRNNCRFRLEEPHYKIRTNLVPVYGGVSDEVIEAIAEIPQSGMR